jgi:5-bromo-4-chloroindolyl phosphate hydrolysis protein
MGMKATTSQLIAGTAGGTIFLVFFLFLRFGIIPSVIIAAVTFALMGIIFKPKRDEMEMNVILDGVTDEALKEILKSGHKKQLMLKELKSKISKPQIRERVDKIIDVVNRIFEDLKYDPKDVKVARQFLNYYLDSTIKILKKYTELSMHSGLANSDVSQSLSKTEELLDKIYTAFEAQLAKLLEDDAMDLDTEVQLLEQTLKMEGLDK